MKEHSQVILETAIEVMDELIHYTSRMVNIQHELDKLTEEDCEKFKDLVAQYVVKTAQMARIQGQTIVQSNKGEIK